jgi:IS5 family transposase
MDRCHLKGEIGDKLHAVQCAAGYNIQWLLRMIAKKGVTFLNRLYLRLQKLRCLNLLKMVGRFKPDLNRVAWA